MQLHSLIRRGLLWLWEWLTKNQECRGETSGEHLQTEGGEDGFRGLQEEGRTADAGEEDVGEGKPQVGGGPDIKRRDRPLEGRGDSPPGPAPKKTKSTEAAVVQPKSIKAARRRRRSGLRRGPGRGGDGRITPSLPCNEEGASVAVNLNTLWEERHRCPDPLAALHFLPEQWAEQLTEEEQEKWALERLCPKCFRSFPDPEPMAYHRDNECQAVPGEVNQEGCEAWRRLSQREAPVPPPEEDQPTPIHVLEQLGAANPHLTPAMAKGAYWGPPIPRPPTTAGIDVEATIGELMRRVEEMERGWALDHALKQEARRQLEQIMQQMETIHALVMAKDEREDDPASDPEGFGSRESSADRQLLMLSDPNRNVIVINSDEEGPPRENEIPVLRAEDDPQAALFRGLTVRRSAIDRCLAEMSSDDSDDSEAGDDNISASTERQ